jgi:hypothetical protein
VAAQNRPQGDKTQADLAKDDLAASKKAAAENRTPTWALGITAVGGLFAVAVGVMALALIACLAFVVQDSTTTPIVTAC